MILDKIKLKMDINKYLNTIESYRTYSNAKTLLNMYYFNPQKWNEMEYYESWYGDFSPYKKVIEEFENYRSMLHQKQENINNTLDDEIKIFEEEQKQPDIIEIDETQSLDDLIANTPADESTGKNTDNGPSFDDE